MFIRTTLALLLAVAARASLATADDVAVTSYLPAGGRVGTTVTVTLSDKFARWPVEVWTSDPGLSAMAAEEKGKLAVTISDDATPGVHYFRLYDTQGESRLAAFVVSTTDELVEQEPNDRRSEAQALSSSATVVNGRLAKSGDVDTFAVDLAAGQTVVAEMAAFRPLGSPMDAVLQIATPSGALLAEEDDSPGFDPRVVFTAPSAGTYLVRTFCFPASPNSSISFSGAPADVYRLTVSTLPFARFAMSHAVGRDEAAPVTVHGWNMPAEGIAVVPTPLAGADSAIVHDEKFTGTLTLPVVDHPVVTRNALTSDADAPSLLDVPITVTGLIDPAETSHEYRITATKDEKLSLTVASRSLGSLLDAVLRVSDSSGKQLAEQDDVGNNPDPALEFTAPADGEYTVSVRDLHRRHDEAFYYNLTVRRVEPSYRVTLASDRFTAKPGEALEIPVNVDRQHGFGEPIEIAISGLPDGFSVEPVTSQPDGDSAKKVTLKLTSPGGGYSGVFRVQGTSGDAGPTVTASAAIEQLGTDVHDVWLTALKGESNAP